MLTLLPSVSFAQLRSFADLWTIPRMGEPVSFHRVDEEVWIVTDTGLWRSDGSALGTSRVSVTPPTELLVAEQLVWVVLDSPRGDKATGLELYVGQARSSSLSAREVRSGKASSDPRGLTLLGDGSSAQPYRVVFSADDGVRGRELWVCDEAGPAQLYYEFVPGPAGSDPIHIAADSARLSCSVSQNGRRFLVGTELAMLPPNFLFVDRQASAVMAGGQGDTWFVDSGQLVVWFPGRPSGFLANLQTTSVTSWQSNFASHPAQNPPTRLAPVFDRGGWKLQSLRVVGSAPTWGVEVRLIDWANIADLTDFASSGGRTFFAGGQRTDDVELLAVTGNGGLLDVTLVADLEPNESSHPRGFAAVGNQVFFTASTGRIGRELWKSDGTANNTALVKDIVVGDRDGCRPLAGAALGSGLGDALLFASESRTNWLWKSDGTSGGTVPVFDQEPSSRPDEFTRLGERIYFTAQVDVAQRALCASDGESVEFVRRFLPSAAVRYLCAYRDQLLFHVGDELWSSDGTDTGTQLLTQLDGRYLTTVGDRVALTVGPEIWIYDGVSFSRLVDTAQNASTWRPFFARAGTGSSFLFADDQLWISDGTTAGTQKLSDAADPQWMTTFGERVLFAASDAANGRELWTSDGTTSGTQVLRDIAVGSASSNPRGFAAAGDRAWFFANGDELWTTDGTANGTTLVKDLGVDPNSLGGLTPIGSRHVYFRAATPASGLELWRSDGTAAGTLLVAEIESGSASGIDTPESEVDRYRWSMGVLRDAVFFSGGSSGDFELMAFQNGATAWRVGEGCGTTTRVPTLAVSDPVLGASQRFDLGNLATGAVGLLYAGFDGRMPLAQDCEFWLHPWRPMFLLEGWVQSSGTEHTSTLALPNDASLEGLRLTLQAIFAPSLAARGFEVSNAIGLALGR